MGVTTPPHATRYASQERDHAVRYKKVVAARSTEAIGACK
jgi:hypothetical protein